EDEGLRIEDEGASILNPQSSIPSVSTERWPSGLRRTLGKRVYVNRVPWVRIPLSPPPTAGPCVRSLYPCGLLDRTELALLDHPGEHAARDRDHGKEAPERDVAESGFALRR